MFAKMYVILIVKQLFQCKFLVSKYWFQLERYNKIIYLHVYITLFSQGFTTSYKEDLKNKF